MLRKLLFRTLICVLGLVSVMPISPSVQAQDDDTIFFVSDDLAYMVQMPPDWVAEGNREDGLTMMSSQALLDRTLQDDDAKFETGDIAIHLVTITPDDLEGAPLSELLEYLASKSQTNPAPTWTETTEMEFGGWTMTYLEGHVEGTHYLTARLGFDIAPGTIALGTLRIETSDDDNFMDELEEVLATLQYSLPLDEEFTNEFVQLDHPTDWVLNTELAPYLLTIYSDVDTQRYFEDPNYQGDWQSGTYNITLFDIAPYGVDTVNLTLEDQVYTLGTIFIDSTQLMVDVQVVEIRGVEVATAYLMDVRTNEMTGIFYVVQMPDFNNVSFIAIATTLPGEVQQISLTTLNILFNIRLPRSYASPTRSE